MKVRNLNLKSFLMLALANVVLSSNARAELGHAAYQPVSAALLNQEQKIYDSSIVQILYHQLLGREPDQVGLQNLLHNVANGLETVQNIESRTLSGSEYLNRGGAAAENITALYRIILHRFPTAREISDGLNQLRSGQTLSQISLSLKSNPVWLEGPQIYDTTYVNEIYWSILGRRGDAAGLNQWSTQIASGYPAADFRKSARLSAEYLGRGGRLGEQVTAIYQTVLRRAPDASGLKSWVATLQRNGFLWQVATDARTSDEFMQLHPELIYTCVAANADVNQPRDASYDLDNCLPNVPLLGILNLPAGTYFVTHGVFLQNPIQIRTQGVGHDAPGCLQGTGACATFRALGDAAFNILVSVRADFSSLNHVVVDGQLGALPTASDGTYPATVNIDFQCSSCSFTQSASINALRVSSVKFLPGIAQEITGNYVVHNGRHDVENGWSDGMTLLQPENSLVAYNTLSDNTDIDMVLGGGKNLKVIGNRITHSADHNSSSFAALQMQSWPTGAGTLQTSGVYDGAELSGNSIDCGSQHNCGFGLQIGADPWYNAFVTGGSVHDNVVTNAQQGFDIEHTSGPVRVYRNRVTNSSSSANSNCGQVQATSNYNVYGSQVDFTSDDVGQQSYKHVKHCLLNPNR